MKLRRGPLGWATASGGVHLAPLIALGFTVNFAQDLLSGVLWVAAWGSIAVLLNLRGVRLDETELVGGHLFGRTRVSRVDAVGAVEMPVWYAQGQLPGVGVVLSDGSRVELEGSVLLGRRRRERWIEAIDRWAQPDGA